MVHEPEMTDVLREVRPQANSVVETPRIFIDAIEPQRERDPINGDNLLTGIEQHSRNWTDSLPNDPTNNPSGSATGMSMTNRSANRVLLLFTLLIFEVMPARANLYSLAVSGTISENSSGDSTIPIGTPWTFELTYNTAAPDRDLELTGSSDPEFGKFTNTSEPFALTFFHYKAGSYEATLNNPADFGPFSVIDITFTRINGIDINIFSPTFFPPLAGGPVSFHADFAAFRATPIFSSDALPTNTSLSPASFDDSNVTLLPHAGAVSGSNLTSLTLTAVEEPFPKGDFNLDHNADASDVAAMLNALTDLKSYQSAMGLGDVNLLSIADVNSDGKVTNADLPALLTLLKSGGETMATVPEPASIVLLVLALAGLAIAVARRLLMNQSVRPPRTRSIKYRHAKNALGSEIAHVRLRRLIFRHGESTGV